MFLQLTLKVCFGTYFTMSLRVACQEHDQQSKAQYKLVSVLV